MTPRSNPKHRTITLTATVPPLYRREIVGQRTICNDLDATAQSVRNWTRIGMPVGGTPARPRYDRGAVCQWFSAYCVEQRRAELAGSRRNGAKVARLTSAQARMINLGLQLRDEPGWFVIVPLSHSHPLREEQLRVAAEGRYDPRDAEDDEEESA